MFSIAFPEEWDNSLFYDADGVFLGADNLRSIFHNLSSGRSWDSLGQALSSMAGWYQPGEEALFIQDVGVLFAQLPSRLQPGSSLAPYWAQGAVDNGASVWLQPGNLYPRYYQNPDGGYDADANVHHWAWALNVGYNAWIHPLAGLAINSTRELLPSQTSAFGGQITWSDIRMGNAGAAMGLSLRFSGDLQGIPSLLESHLGVGQ